MDQREKQVIIVEDDRDIADLIEIHLEDMNCQVDKETNGEEAYKIILEKDYDLIILDIMLPGMDGLTICRKLRRSENTVPIIMLTAKSQEVDKILGLESGADIYIPKPFSILEFKARVKALFRRINISRSEEPQEEEQLLEFDGLTIDRTKRKVLRDGEEIQLTPKEFELLSLLAAHPGRSYSRQQLLQKVWGYEYNAYEHTVNSHINRLRNKIEPDMSDPKFILTTWGIGYRFAEEIR